MITIWDNYKSVVFYLQGAGPEGAGGAVPSLGQPKERGDDTIWRNYQFLPGDPDRTGQDYWYDCFICHLAFLVFFSFSSSVKNLVLSCDCLSLDAQK